MENIEKLQNSQNYIKTALGKLQPEKNNIEETKQALAPSKHARRYGFGLTQPKYAEQKQSL